ncbi:MAG TPA: translesion DNA synthesis-associated protein ImuA [Steroidobacteraceae bacterium]|nr:translesion DNA synthesis-associated protein ImuA [Steroidobacteraceae bacterium]
MPESGTPRHTPSSALTRLLEHPAIWRGRSTARLETVPTGFADLDARLPGGGWPRSAVVEVFARLGSGELSLLLPALSALTSAPLARWCAWIAPPLEPHAPALAACGLDLGRLLVVRTGNAAWACEQALRSAACDAVVGWIAGPLAPRAVRRLQLAAQRGRTLGFILRPLDGGPCAGAGAGAGGALRLRVDPCERGARITLLKSRGGRDGELRLDFAAFAACGTRDGASATR